ncbi:tetraspanin-5-like [Dendronephthya gigantea]|uniref:tetraspanin-5-like n=1 Tax=Dendronephthya gigantea TaxID=151771 RepID=UPI00106D70A6|nr:tetraspanin-5-like [Dendronephthya gigantea]
MARRRDQSEVSTTVKYLLFFFNVIFWLLGGACLAIGIYARFENASYSDFFGNAWSDPAFFFIIVGGIMFILGFTGCIGALRENICLLKFFSIALGVIFCLQILLGILVFVYRDKFDEIVKEKLQDTIVSYRDNPDLRSLIDKVQTDFECCGVNDFNDWDDNIYFNCSQKTTEACGVPSSCCIKDRENKQCGYGVREKNEKKIVEVEDKIYVRGCVEGFAEWVETNIIMIGAIALGIAVVQIMGISCSQSLIGDIKSQKSRWDS